MRRFICAFIGLLQILAAQTGSSTSPAAPAKLAFIVPDLVEQLTASLDPSLRPLLRTEITPSLGSVNSALAAHLSNVPVPSPSSGYRYIFDPSLGVYVQKVQSLGPVLSERAETLGKGRLFFAATWQRFSFDRIDDLDLRGFTAGFPVHIPLGAAGQLPALVVADTIVQLSLTQTTAHFTYGLARFLDVSFALPVVRSAVVVSTQARITDTTRGQVLSFLPRQWSGASSTGLGDGVVRIKGKILGTERFGVAAGTDIRLPTGDEFDYHGTGAYGVKPFVVLSMVGKYLSPHVNAGYQWNGSSFLASPSADRKQPLPSQLFYAAGFDTGITEKLTLAFDFFHQWIRKGQRTFVRQVEAGAAGSYGMLSFPYVSRNEYNAATGVKAALPGGAIIVWNLVFRLNDAGLRARVVPTVGMSIVF